MVRRHDHEVAAKDAKIAALRCALTTSAERRKNAEQLQKTWHLKAKALHKKNAQLLLANKSTPSAQFQRSVTRKANAKVAAKVVSVLGRAAKMEKHQAHARKLYHAMKKYDFRRVVALKIKQKEKASAYDFESQFHF